MDVNEVRDLVLAAFPESEVDVDLAGGHYTVTVISEGFTGVRSVARQQRVYAPLASAIAAGHMHACGQHSRLDARRSGGLS